MTETLETLNSPEVWESTTGGTFFVQVKDPRLPGAWTQKRVGGKGSQRIQLTVEERQYNSDQVSEESKHHDPFTNGQLVRVSPKSAERGRYELNDEELILVLTAGEDEAFEDTILNTKSEVILRRMLFLAERNATMYRFNLLKAIIDDRYSIGKTSRVVQEQYDDDERYADVDI